MCLKAQLCNTRKRLSTAGWAKWLDPSLHKHLHRGKWKPPCMQSGHSPRPSPPYHSGQEVNRDLAGTVAPLWPVPQANCKLP